MGTNSFVLIHLKFELQTNYSSPLCKNVLSSLLVEVEIEIEIDCGPENSLGHKCHKFSFLSVFCLCFVVVVFSVFCLLQLCWKRIQGKWFIVATKGSLSLSLAKLIGLVLQALLNFKVFTTINT